MSFMMLSLAEEFVIGVTMLVGGEIAFQMATLATYAEGLRLKAINFENVWRVTLAPRRQAHFH